MASLSCKRSWIKNSSSVAGMALAMPLKMNTAIRRLKPGWRHGSQSSDAPTPWRNQPKAGRGASAQAHHASASATANTATITGRPSKVGNTDAVTTPHNPAPSRQATMRARVGASPPSRAPQDWWQMLNQLNARYDSTSATHAHSSRACCARTGGKNSAVRPSTSTSAATSPVPSTTRGERA